MDDQGSQDRIKFPIIETGDAMNRPLAILLLILIIVGLLFSTFALFRGEFVAALLVYPLLVFAYIFLRLGKRK